MEPQNLEKIKQEISKIKPILIRLQWDKDHDQLNPGKLPYLESLQKQYQTLKEQLTNEQTEDPEV